MKKLNAITILLLCVATISLSSCFNSDNDDTSITAEKQKTYQTMISGTYSGMTRLYKYDSSANSFVKTDSTTNVVWRMNTDSTITIANFPVSFFAEYINATSAGSSELTSLKTALASASAQTVKAFYCIPSSNYVTSTYIQYVVTGIIFSLTYDGATHEVVIPVNYYNSLGQWATTSEFAYVSMVTGGLYLDKTSYSSYMSTTGITMDNK